MTSKKDIVEIFLRDAVLADLVQAAEAMGMRVVPINDYQNALSETKDPTWAVAIELARIANAVDKQITLSRTLSATEFKARLRAIGVSTSGSKPPF